MGALAQVARHCRAVHSVPAAGKLTRAHSYILHVLIAGPRHAEMNLPGQVLVYFGVQTLVAFERPFERPFTSV